MTQHVELSHPGLHYRMVVPTAWTALPTDPVAMRTAVRRWLLRRLSHLSRDETVSLRRRVEDELVALAAVPGAEYARHLLVLALDVADVPVTATCLVSVVPQHAPDGTALSALALELAVGASSAEVTAVGAWQGVVVVRDVVPVAREAQPSDRELADVLSAGGPTGDVSPAEVARQRVSAERARSVDVYLPVPEARQTLLLSFSTPLVPLFDAMTELFLTMASTVQFRGADDVWS